MREISCSRLNRRQRARQNGSNQPIWTVHWQLALPKSVVCIQLVGEDTLTPSQKLFLKERVSTVEQNNVSKTQNVSASICSGART